MKKKEILILAILLAITVFYVMRLYIKKEKNKLKQDVKQVSIVNDHNTITELSMAGVAEFANNNLVNMKRITMIDTSADTDDDIMKDTFGWLTTNANVRLYPHIDSEIVTTLQYRTKITYYLFNSEWACIQYKGRNCYIHRSLISNTEISQPEYVEYNTPFSKRMSYMPYQAITNKNSNQYRLQQKAYTGTYGIRQVNNRYCIAVGSAYTTEIGTYIDLILKNETVIPCVLGDCKADIHTDSSNRISGDGSLAEFIVDKPSLSNIVRKMGQLEYACEEWDSTIIKIRIYDMKEDF